MPGPAKSPLAYLGVKAPRPPNVIRAQRAPAITDKFHDLGTVWIHESARDIYQLASVTAGSAFWLQIGGDPTTNYVVDTNDSTAYQTVQAAIDAAQTAGVHAAVYVRPGTYTENLTLYDGIMVQGAGLETTITGVHTPPASGTITFYDITLTSATDIVTSAAAGTTKILFHNCLINCTDGYTADLDNWTGTIVMVQCAEASTANGVVNNTGGATVSLWDTVCGAGTTKDFTLDDGALTMFNTRMVCQAALGGSTTIAAIMGCSFAGTVTTAGTVSGTIDSAAFSTGATSSISHGSTGTLQVTNTSITATTTAIAGAGTGAITLSGIEFVTNSTIATTLTIGRSGLSYTSNDLEGRSINVTNTNIESFNVNPVLQSIATTGAAPTGATGDYNVMSCQEGVTMEQFILGAGQTIIAPRLADDGLLVSLDLTVSEGAEYYFGHTTLSKHAYTIGTSAAFYVEATFKVADCGTSDPLWLGFRKLGAPNAAFANYTDAGVIGLHNTTGADTVVIGSNLNNAGWAYVDSTDAWADGETHKLKVCISPAGVVTYRVDNVPPVVTQALTLDTGDVVIPFIHHLFAAGGTPAAIHLTQLSCGLQ